MAQLFKKSSFIWITIILSLFYLGMLERIWHSRQAELQNTISGNIDLVESSIKSSIHHHDSLTRTILNLEIKQPEILEIIQKANHASDTEKNNLRKILLNRLQPAYEMLKQQGIRQLHFHLPNGESFLRMHRPDGYGDLLFSVRHSVYLANTEKKPIKGFEEGRVFNGYRFVYPLTLQGQHIGSVETSVGYDYVGGTLERIKPYHSYFIFSKQLMQNVLFFRRAEKLPAQLFF